MGGKPLDPQYMRKYYLANREKLIQQERERYYRIRNTPEFKAKVKLARELRHYGRPLAEILAKTGGKCSRCPQPATLAHHIDRDGRNHERVGKTPGTDIDRLEPLCRRCHATEHAEEMKAARRAKYATRWAREYDACVDCSRTDRKHNGHGVCVSCASRRKRKAKQEPGV